MLFTTRRFSARKAHEKDIEAIRRIESMPANRDLIFQYSFEEHLAFMKTPRHCTLLFYQGEELLGYALITQDEKNRSFELKRIALTRHGEGFGREIMHGIHTWAFEDLAVHRLWLDVFEDNKRAIYLYESMGYVYEGTLRHVYLSEIGFRSMRVYSLLEEEYNTLKENL